MRLFIGKTGSGKGNAMVWELLDVARERQRWIVANFPHARDGELFISELYHHFGQAVFDFLQVEYLTFTKRVVMRRFLHTSSADGMDRDTENDEFRWAMQQTYAQRRKIGDLGEFPVLDKYSDLILNVGQHQDAWYPEDKLGRMLIPLSKEWWWFYNHCTEDELKEEMLALLDFNKREQIAMLEPVVRLHNGLFRPALIRARCSKPPTFDKREFLNKAGIIVYLGGHTSPDAWRNFGGSDFMETQYLARKGLERGGVYLVDEFNNYGFPAEPVSRALSTLRFTGMDIWTAVQSLDFPTPDITRNFLQNCEIWAFKLTDPETADRIAGTMRHGMDEYKVHHEDETIRNVPNVRYEERRTKGTWTGPDKSKGGSESVSIVPVTEHTERVDKKKVFQPGHEQVFWKAAVIQDQSVGQCCVVPKTGKPYQWQVPLVEDSWVWPAIRDPVTDAIIEPGLAQVMLNECIQKLYSTAVYEEPVKAAIPAPTGPAGDPRRKQPKPQGNAAKKIGRPRGQQ